MSATLCLNNQSFLEWNNLRIKFRLLLLIQNLPQDGSVSSLLKSMYICVAPFSIPTLLLLRTGWLGIPWSLLYQSHWSNCESFVSTLFWVILIQEFSLFLKSVNWQMFLCCPLLPHSTKGNDALAHSVCQEVNFSVFEHRDFLCKRVLNNNTSHIYNIFFFIWIGINYLGKTWRIRSEKNLIRN